MLLREEPIQHLLANVDNGGLGEEVEGDVIGADPHKSPKNIPEEYPPEYGVVQFSYNILTLRWLLLALKRDSLLREVFFICVVISNASFEKATRAN